jgi:DNA invertase Pin-like site-specific DNA recombinase
LRDSGGDAQEQSVPQQKAELTGYCQRYGLVIAHIFADVAKSAASVVGRDAFLDMVDMSADAELRPVGLLLWNFARFARDLDDSSYYKALLRRNGLVIHSLTDPIPDGIYGRIVETIIDIANEEKRRQTGRDVKRALRAIFQQGYSFGIPPRGYLREQVVIGRKRDGSERKGSRWVPDPEVWDLVKLAWQLRAEGRPYEAIQRATDRRVYISKNCWATFFSNKAYLGVGVWGELEIPDHHPAAIDQATWQAVQKVREGGMRGANPGNMYSRRRVIAPSLLSGVAVCAHCGSALSYDITNRNTPAAWPFYICGKKTRQGWKSCPGRMINSRRADQAILDAVMNRVLTLDYFSDLLEETRRLLSDTAALDREIEDINKNLAENDKAIHNLLDLAETFGALSAGERLREREGEKVRLDLALQELEAKRKTAEAELAPEALTAALEAWRTRLVEAQQKDDILGMKYFLTRFVSKIEVDYHTARLFYTYPIDDLNSLINSAISWGHKL